MFYTSREMAATMSFPALRTSLSQTMHKPSHTEMKKPQWQTKNSTMRSRPRQGFTYHKVMSTLNSSNTGTNLSPSGTIKKFYTCINDKNIKQLGDYISNDCFFEDFSFPKPFQGKKEVLGFLVQLTTGMGKNLEFHIGHVYEGDDCTAGVRWHLEWKKKQVPFTRGCSLYELTNEGQRLVIRKAQVFIESPIKPGDVLLNVLKTVTSLFDANPEATEWFFKSQHVILQLILKIYNIVLVPFMGPIVVFYVNIGKFIATMLSLAIKILAYCSRLFTSRDD